MSKRVVDVASGSGGRKKGKASDCLEITSKAQKKRYNSLASREIMPTSYPDNSTLAKLGITQDVRMLLGNLGWLMFLDPPLFTYQSLTLEFLSFLCVDREKLSENEPGLVLSFRLLNVNHELTFEDFCQRLGFTNTGILYYPKNPSTKPDSFAPNQFWLEISGQENFNPRTAKVSQIHNHVFRYIHRIMACTVFGRGETGGVRAAELFLLWVMVYNHPANTCYYILDHLAYVAEQTKGQTAVGGMVTYISKRFGIDTSRIWSPVPGTGFIDINTFLVTKMIKTLKPEHYQLLISGEPSILLPNPERTKISVVENWICPHVGLQVQEEGHVPDEPAHEAAEEYMHMEEEHQPTHGGYGDPEWYARIERDVLRQGADFQSIMTAQHGIITAQQRNDDNMQEVLRGQQRHGNMLAQMMQYLKFHQPPPQ